MTMSMLAYIASSLLLPLPVSCGAFVFTPAHELARNTNIDHAEALEGQLAGQQLGLLLSEATDRPPLTRAGFAKGRTYASVRARVNEEKTSQQHFMEAQTAFDDASSHSASPEEQAIKRDLAKAMATASTLGKPDRRMTAPALQCQQDLTKCPKDWHPRGVLCYANPTYAGPCAPEADLFSMGVEEKLAFGRYCKVDFPCQENCAQDFRAPCPSMWQELQGGCVAPAEYVGECSRLADTSEMSDKDKFLFGLNCGARWPCMPSPLHVYGDICPQGWVAQFGHVCTSPNDYTGPCGRIAQMGGMRIAEKKQFEASCDVSWPVARAPACLRDYTACPFGWLRLARKGALQCKAPLMYRKCSPWHDFALMSPAEKEEWQHLCGQNFPCLARDACEKDWAAACPGDWYAVDGGLSCIAPTSYNGNCSAELRGLFDLSASEKGAVAKRCGLSWPCQGEAGDVTEFSTFAKYSAPRGPLDPAHYVLTNGPIDSDRGAIARSAPRLG